MSIREQILPVQSDTPKFQLITEAYAEAIEHFSFFIMAGLGSILGLGSI